MKIKKPKNTTKQDEFAKELQTSNIIEDKFKSLDKEENLEKIYQNLTKAVQLNAILPSSFEKP